MSAESEWLQVPKKIWISSTAAAAMLHDELLLYSIGRMQASARELTLWLIQPINYAQSVTQWLYPLGYSEVKTKFIQQ